MLGLLDDMEHNTYKFGKDAESKQVTHALRAGC